MLRSLLAAAAIVCTASPAAAQSDFWVGVTTDAISQAVGQSVNQGVAAREAQCMRGEIPSLAERWMTEIRSGANTTMARYFNLAAASEGSDVGAAFSRLRRTRTWQRTSDGSTGDIESINDPLARAGGARLGEPAQFFLAGDQLSAAGLWLVRDSEGELLGHYRAVFRRERSVWRLLHLDVGEGAEPPAPLTAYCHQPGDVHAPAFAESADTEASAKPSPETAEPVVAPPPMQ
jgi:hypothetical protein